MLKILKFARKYWYVMVAILLLLIVQAFCDLALPEYTSKIVDVGIQSGGIESPVPETLRGETHDTLAMFMTDEELKVYNDAYEKEESSSAEGFLSGSSSFQGRYDRKETGCIARE